MSEHWPDCYRLPNHPVCAQRRIAELEVEVKRLQVVVADTLTAEAQKMGLYQTATGPVPCFPDPMLLAKAPSDCPVGPLVTHDLSDGMYPKTPFVVFGTPGDTIPVQRIPGSASWTAPAVDDPPTVLDAKHPHP